MNKKMMKLAANFVLFQIGWFVCVLSSDAIALYVTSTILFIHFLAVGDWRKEKEIIAICLFLGCTIDSFLGNLGVLEFHSDSRLLPVWLACIWALLGTTLLQSLAWTGRYPLIGALLGFIGGPVAYYSGSQLTDVTLRDPLWQTLLILAILWAAIIPLLQTFVKVWQKRLENQKS